MRHRLQDPAPAASEVPGQFSFVAPVTVFEDLSKSDENRQMRIAGIISTQSVDLQDECILQDGLNFDDFLGARGFFNNDHKKGFLDILGYPESVSVINKGEPLPDGSTATVNTTWCEGYLLNTTNGRETFELAKALMGSGRSLGFSVEGEVEERQGRGGKLIAKARIKHVAITHQPVNTDSRLDVLLRSLAATCRKGTTLTTDGAPPSTPGGTVPKGRNANGMLLSRESLSSKVVATASGGGAAKKRKRGRKRAKKSLGSVHLLESLYSEFPDLRPSVAVEWVKAIQLTRAR